MVVWGGSCVCGVADTPQSLTLQSQQHGSSVSIPGAGAALSFALEGRCGARCGRVVSGPRCADHSSQLLQLLRVPPHLP
jgi:hypothetical protein